MKKQLLISIILATVLFSFCRAQEADTLLKLVLEHNRNLNVAREALQVAFLEAGSGITPPDPEVELGYLFGKPSEMGNRVDIGITQQLDFPTAYLHRSNIKKIKRSRAELEYILTRQEVLLEARRLLIERIHLNQLGQLLSNRLRQAEIIQAHMQGQLDAGEAGLLEVGQSNLLVASVEGETEEVNSLIRDNQLSLAEITGGIPFELDDTIFPRPVAIIPDSLINAYRQGAGVQLHQQQMQIKEEEKNLAVSNHLPRLSAGYYSESVTDQAFRGFRMGLSVPLWENANTVKKAQSEVVHAEAEMDHYIYRQEREIRQKLNELQTLQTRVEKLDSALDSANSLALLEALLQSGEISFSEYFYSSDFYFRNQQQLLRYQRDLLIREAELLKIYF
jgi:cobalt-zinc-cadmium efflux system outer membrane protein